MKLKTMTELEVLQCAYLFVESQIEDEMRVYRAANNSTKSLKVMGDHFERLKELKEAIKAIYEAPNNEELPSDETSHEVFDDIKSIIDNYLNNLYKAITKVVTLTYDTSIPYDYRVPFQTAISPVQYAFNMLENNLIGLLEKYQGEDSNEDIAPCEICMNGTCETCTKISDHCRNCEKEGCCSDCEYKMWGNKNKLEPCDLHSVADQLETVIEGIFDDLKGNVKDAKGIVVDKDVADVLRGATYNYRLVDTELREILSYMREIANS